MFIFVWGRLIVPVGDENQVFTQVDKKEDGTFVKKSLFGVRYVPLVKSSDYTENNAEN